MLAVGADSVDFTVIAGCDIQGAGVVENDVPNVLGTGIEIGCCTPRGVRSRLGGGAFLGLETPGVETIHLAVGGRGSVDDAFLVDDQSLHLQFLGSKMAMLPPSGVMR